jgi:hypothetical protein
MMLEPSAGFEPHDLLREREMLYQLSYEGMVGVAGLEPHDLFREREVLYQLS